MIHRSPALTAIYNEVKRSSRNKVLDLGPMTQGCFELFSSLSCNIAVEDLASYVAVHAVESHGKTLDFEGYLQGYPKDQKFDVVLMWDILNYLTLDQMAVLFSKLRPLLKPNSLVYMLRYTRKSIPSVPRFFYVKDQYTVEMTEGDMVVRDIPVASTLQLLSAMPGAYMQETIVNKMGMQADITEHVVRYSPTSDRKYLVSKAECSSSVNASAVLESLHVSPSLALVDGVISKSEGARVLSLGVQSAGQKDFFVEAAADYYSADVFHALQVANENHCQKLNLSMLDYEMSLKFDVILVWDIFNFCTQTQLAQLERALARHSHSQTLLLSYFYTGKTLPNKPSEFQVIDESHVKISKWRDQVQFESRSAAFTGASLLRAMTGFNLNKSFAYRDGMDRQIIEYLFVGRAENNVIELFYEKAQ